MKGMLVGLEVEKFTSMKPSVVNSWSSNIQTLRCIVNIGAIVAMLMSVEAVLSLDIVSGDCGVAAAIHFEVINAFCHVPFPPKYTGDIAGEWNLWIRDSIPHPNTWDIPPLFPQAPLGYIKGACHSHILFDFLPSTGYKTFSDWSHKRFEDIGQTILFTGEYVDGKMNAILHNFERQGLKEIKGCFGYRQYTRTCIRQLNHRARDGRGTTISQEMNTTSLNWCKCWWLDPLVEVCRGPKSQERERPRTCT